MAANRPPVFHGRVGEREHLRRLLDKVRTGESAALVVRGEAGIGKTAIVDYSAGRATGFRVVRIAGVESETELPFAGLHQLCGPILAEVDNLPAPQLNALQVAFGLAVGDVPDRFLVALGTLSLLAEMSRKRPLLCIIDDAQWLDTASGQVLGFVARRILAESVLMIFAVREPTGDRQFAGLPELVLHGLNDQDSQSLLATAIPGRVDPSVLDRIVAETRGNPLALLELPRGMTAAELAGGFAAPYTRDLLEQLEEHFLGRFETLPERTQRLMLVAAADPTGDVDLLWRTAQVLGIGRDAAADIDGDQLIEIGERVRFRHPLVRSAIYAGASSEERRTVHLALAAAMDSQSEPDRRAWHRALAAAGPDEEVASELERSASRAQSRAGLAGAAAFLQRSVALTQDPTRRTDRALAAARAQLQAGMSEEALRLLAVAEANAETELQRAQADLLRGQIAAAGGAGAEASALLLKAARRMEPLNVTLARETYLDAWAASMLAGVFGRRQLREVSQAARVAPPSTDPRLPDLLLDGLSLLITEGLEAATPSLRRAVSAFPTEDLSIERGLQWGALASTAAATLWDFESMSASNSRQTELARRAGALAPLCITLTADVFNMVWRGDLADAAALAAETEAISDATGIRIAPYGALLLAALRGDEQHGLMFIETTVDRARVRGEGTAVQVGLWTNAVLYNGLTRYDRALPLARQASEEAPEFFIGPWALPELIEAAVRTGHDSVAAAALERLGGSAGGSESDWGAGILARCRALLSSVESAEEHYREAIECYGRTPLRPDHARAHLLFGEWLRRQKRHRDARVQLRIAHDMFDEIGMVAFAERAANELRATGETVRERRMDRLSDLTPQEEQIARLAMEGRTNPEIGAQLYISSRTVEWHLRKVFSKLGITSRKGLRSVLPARARTSRGD